MPSCPPAPGSRQALRCARWRSCAAGPCRPFRRGTDGTGPPACRWLANRCPEARLRFLPTRLHGVVDYVWGLALLASPWVLSFADVPAAKWIAIVFGIGAILYSLVTAYELGLVPLLPMRLHLMLDGLAGFVLAITPWGF